MQSLKQLAVGLAGVMVVLWILLPGSIKRLWSDNQGASPPPAGTVPEALSDRPVQQVFVPPVAGEVEFIESESGKRERYQAMDDNGIALGEELFSSAERLKREIPDISSAVHILMVNRLDAESVHQAGIEPITSTEWPELVVWFRGHYQDAYSFEGLETDAWRFRRLASHPLTEAEAEEVRELINKCGTEYLKLPFDRATQQFRFVPLPDVAPDVALEKYKTLYRLLTNKTWSYSAPAEP